MNTAEFEAILSATVIPSYMSLEEQNAVLAPLSEHVRSIVPKALFRYRSCNERNLEAFIRIVAGLQKPKI